MAGRPISWGEASRRGGDARDNESVSLQLRVRRTEGRQAGLANRHCAAKGVAQSIDLPLTLTIASETPAKLTIKTKLPSLHGGRRNPSFDTRAF